MHSDARSELRARLRKEGSVIEACQYIDVLDDVLLV